MSRKAINDRTIQEAQRYMHKKHPAQHIQLYQTLHGRLIPNLVVTFLFHVDLNVRDDQGHTAGGTVNKVLNELSRFA